MKDDVMPYCAMFFNYIFFQGILVFRGNFEQYSSPSKSSHSFTFKKKHVFPFKGYSYFFLNTEDKLVFICFCTKNMKKKERKKDYIKQSIQEIF